MGKAIVRLNNRSRSRRIFTYVMLAYPLIHFFIFYIGVNINSIFLALKQYDGETLKYTFLPINRIAENFVAFFNDVKADITVQFALKNSLWMYLVSLLISTPLNILFAYALYKKCAFNGFLRVVLFLPAILPSMVLVLAFKYFVIYGWPVIAKSVLGMQDFPLLLYDIEYVFPMMIVFGLWTSFGSSLMLYSNTMSKIPDSLIEYGQLEGISRLREIWHIVLPFIYPTLTTFLVTGIAGYFTATGPMYAFYQSDAPPQAQSIGYYLFIKVFGNRSSPYDFPYAAAGGLLFTFFAVPLTLFVKRTLEKYGPDIQY